MKKVIDCTLEIEGFIGHFYPGTSHALVDGIDAFSEMTKFVFKKILPAEKNIQRNVKLQDRIA